MLLNEFVEQSLTLAGVRNLSVENPVLIRVNSPIDNEEFQVIVSLLEPSFSVLPYNVTWIVADPNSADYKRALRRVTSLPFADYRNTWEILTSMDDLFAVAQYYEYSGSFQLGEVEMNGITQATVNVRGKVMLLNPPADPENPVVVCSNDPRMMDARIPLPHSHPLMPADMLAGSTGINEFFVTIKDGMPPVAGQVLMLTGAGDEPNEYVGIWRNLNQSDVDYAGPSFDDLEIYTSAVQFDEQQTYVFRANAHFSDSSVLNNVPALWSIVQGGSFANISATTGTFNSGNVVGDQPVRIQATWTHAPSGTVRNKTFDFVVRDVTVYRVLESIEIQGPTSINEGNQATYSVIAHYDDSTSQGVIPTSFISSNAAAGSFNSTTGIFTAAQQVGNATTSISASYSEGGVSKSATVDLTVVDTTVYPVSASINGVTSVDENTSTTYSFIVSFSNGTSSAVAVNNWQSSQPSVGTINAVSGVLTANEVNSNQTTIVGASYTSEGVTVTATRTVTVRDTTVYPQSAQIIGNANVNEGGTSSYQLRVNFTDGTNLIVPVTNWASTNTTVATINATSGVLNATADVKPSQTTIISASYTSAGVTVSDSRTITIVDTTVYPQSATILGGANIDEGSTVQLQLQVAFTDSTSGIRPALTWVSSNPAVATITSDGTIAAAANVVGNQQFDVTATFAQNGETVSTTRTFTIVDRTSYPVSATIVGPASVNEGVDTQYQLSVTFADSSTRVVNATSWNFSNAAAGSVSSIGMFTPVANTQGNKNGTISASYTLDGTTVNATKPISVVDTTAYPNTATIQGPTTVNESTTAQYQLAVNYSNGTTSFASGVTWSLTAGSTYASIDSTGLLTVNEVSIGNKPATISATYTVDGVTVTDTHNVTLVDTTVYPQSIQIVGATSVNEGTNSNFTAQVTYTDSSVQDKTGDVTWALTDSTHAAINAAGVVSVQQIIGGNKSTTVQVSYTENGVTVTDTHALSLVDTTVYPQSATIVGPNTFNEGDPATQFIFRITKTDSSTEDVVVNNWQNSNPSAGTLLNDGTFTPAASVTGAALTTTITASYTFDGVTVNGTLNVSVGDTTVYPSSATILGSDTVDENNTAQYQLRITYSNGSQGTVTVNSWTVDSTALATIDSSGLLTVGAITGTNNSVTVSADFTLDGVTVTGTKVVALIDTTVYLSSVAISGPTQVTEGAVVNFILDATYTDSSTQAISSAAWSVNPTTYGSIDATGAFTAATGFAGDHPVVVTASYTENGVTKTDTHNLLVKDAQPYPVTADIVAPTNVNEGQSSALQFRVNYSDSSNVLINSGVNWSVDNAAYGSVDANGVFTAAQVLNGNKVINVTGTYTENGITVNETATITVVDTTKYPVSIVITGATQVDESTTSNYTATVTYTDSSTANVSGVANWSVTGVGSINASGVYSAPAVGSNQNITLNVSYTEAGTTVTDTHAVTVRNVVIVPQSVVITGPATVPAGTNANYVATVTYSDSTTAVRTTTGTWGVSNASAGSIGANSGVFTAGAGAAATNITFSYTENGATVSHTLPINVTVVSTPMARWGIGQFSDTDFTGGKTDPNLEGTPYQRWANAQAFFTSVLTNQMASNANGTQFSTSQPDLAKYAYFAHPSSLGTATFVDQSTMFPGGWDGVKWTPEDDFGASGESGPIELTLDDGSGPRLWKIYRTDFSGIGNYTWSVSYS